MRTESTNARLTIDIPVAMHRLVKAHATLNDLSIKDFIIESIEMRFDKAKPAKKTSKKDRVSKNVPNAKTVASIKNSIKNYDKLKSFSNVDDMMADLLDLKKIKIRKKSK
ncbi:MAG: hypothetical protein KGQ36_02155 [Rickettsiales bacterium]|nr:hypothetical protein [Rickettsiales bacterium]